MHQLLLIKDIPHRKNNFDALRLIAAVIVLFEHAFALTGNSAHAVQFYFSPLDRSYGDLAVKIFFIISGYLITESFIREPELWSFMKKRILRVFPALIITVLLTVFVLGPLVTTASDYFNNPMTYDYLKFMDLFQDRYVLPGVFEHNAYKQAVNGSLWTLKYEFTFYIAIALLGISNLLQRKRIILFIWIGFIIADTLKIPTHPLNIGTIESQKFIDLGLFYFSGVVVSRFKEFIPIDTWFATLCVILLLFSIKYHGVPNSIFAIIGVYVLIYFVFSPNINLSWVSKYGDFSYGMYIFAFPIQQLVTYWHGGKTDPYTNFFESLILTSVCAVISWHLIEKPCLRLKSTNLKDIFIRKNKEITN